MFQTARIKLTAWYLLIIMCVSVSFSAIIYRVLTREVERFARAQRFRIEHPPQNGITPRMEFFENGQPKILATLDPDLIAETNKRILWSLITLNGVIVLLSGGLSYLLAGRTLDPIKRMVDEQNQFISDASHELRTPLTSLKSALEVNLRDKKLTLEQSKKVMAENILEVNNLQALSDNLLQLAQFQTPHVRQLFEPVDAKKVINDAMAKVQALSRVKHITIHTKATQATIWGNSYSLIDLLIIVLDNAIKYSAKNSTITIETHTKEPYTLIRVMDNGCGIAQSDITHIFDRFYRADTARSDSSTKGYGLGLSIAKQIVNLHQGTIHVTSTINKGTTITMSLPKKRIHKPIQKYFS
ncbi:HAMP domain-containing histidine kinase [Candidatus Woesebacteria bacterium]|nr:HAMP domain-containing histidine kinase [Candidatus Woesebacteria bacterium]